MRKMPVIEIENGKVKSIDGAKVTSEIETITQKIPQSKSNYPLKVTLKSGSKAEYYPVNNPIFYFAKSGGFWSFTYNLSYQIGNPSNIEKITSLSTVVPAPNFAFMNTQSERAKNNDTIIAISQYALSTADSGGKDIFSATPTTKLITNPNMLSLNLPQISVDFFSEVNTPQYWYLRLSIIGKLVD